jgi:hypothetical protein
MLIAYTQGKVVTAAKKPGDLVNVPQHSAEYLYRAAAAGTPTSFRQA